MPHVKILKAVWTSCLVLVGVGLIILTFSKGFSIADLIAANPSMLVFRALMSFIGEYVDSSLGMGYGTTLTPVLLILGFEPMQVVPAVLLSEFFAGIGAGGMHHRLGNVDLGRGTKSRKIMLILAACSIVGTVAAVILAVKLPKDLVKLYIGLMILAVGIFIIFGSRVFGGFSWGKIIGLGTVAAFNKGISGGGYGPLVTGGQIVVGVPEKNAVGITAFAEGLVCLVGLILYFLLSGWWDWRIALPMALGGLLSVPVAAWTVKILPGSLIRSSIGYATVFLGVMTLIKVVL